MARSTKSSKSAGKVVVKRERGVKAVSHKSKQSFKKKASRPAKKNGEKKSAAIATAAMAIKKEGTGKGREVGGREVGGVKTEKDVSETSTRKRKVSSAAMATRKERRVHRKQQHSNFELVRESKVIWEHLRPNKATPSKTLAQDEIMALAKGHFKELALKHDTARVVQSCLKNGTAEHRTCVFSELKDNIVDLCKTKYSKFVVKSLLKYCSAVERSAVISSLYGQVRKLVRHAEAGEVVETAYNEYANGKQRTALVQEFYGTEFALFKTSQGDTAGGRPESLGEVLAAYPERRGRILQHTKDSLIPLLEKTVVRHSIVHRALIDYLLHCSTEARAELIEGLREKLVNILHTKDGSRVALQCIWHGTSKDRKIIVKSFKGLVGKICQEENGHIVMMGLFDSVDDTVLIRKVILNELNKHLQTLSEDQYGRRVLLYLLTPRSPRHFSPQFVALLSPGDLNTHTKKSADIRRKELLESVASPLLTLVATNAVKWAQSTPHAPLLLEIAESMPGDLSPLYKPLLEALCGDDGGKELTQHPCAHWVIKKLISVNKESVFVEELVSRLRPEQACDWAGTNRGGFVLSALISVGGGTASKVGEMLSPLHTSLATSSLKGQQAIHNALTQHTELII